MREDVFENIKDSQLPKVNFIFLPKWSKERFVSPNSYLKSWFLESLIHNKAPNENLESTLGRRIINDPKMHWGTVLKVHGEFYYHSHYWEWLEILVVRNTTVHKRACLFNSMMTSIYTYDRNSDIV